MLKIILCALNEAQNLQTLIPNLSNEIKSLGANFKIIICIDGSNDESFSLLTDLQKKHPLEILPLKNEIGLGLAYKRLFTEIVNNSDDDDLAISFDCDNTHNPEQIAAMLNYFHSNSLDFLVASRFCNSSVIADFPIHRKFITKTTSLILQNLFAVKRISGKKLQDYTSGYRIYRAKKLKELFAIQKNNFITEPEFTYTCELLIKLARINSRLDEIPISYDYGKKNGKSKLRILRNFWRLMILLLKLQVRL